MPRLSTRQGLWSVWEGSVGRDMGVECSSEGRTLSICVPNVGCPWHRGWWESPLPLSLWGRKHKPIDSKQGCGGGCHTVEGKQTATLDTEQCKGALVYIHICVCLGLTPPWGGQFRFHGGGNTCPFSLFLSWCVCEAGLFFAGGIPWEKSLSFSAASAH